MLNKTLAYRLFCTGWIIFLALNIAEFKSPAEFDIIPFLHVSNIPYLKYILIVIFAFLIIPFHTYIGLIRNKKYLYVIIFLGLLLALAFISSYYSPYPETAFRVTARFLFYFLILIITLAAAVRFDNATSFILKSFIYISSLIIIGSLLDFFVPPFHKTLIAYFDRPPVTHSYLMINGDIVMRPMGFVTDANLAAFAIGFGLLLLLLNSNHFNSVFRYSYFILGSFAFGMLTSRIALVMCFVVLFGYFILKAVPRKELLIFCILFVIFQAVTAQTFSRVSNLLNPEKIEEEFTVGRPVIWAASFKLYTEHPLIGAGPGVFFEVSKDYMSELIASSENINITDPSKPDFHQVDKMNPHNIFLVMLSETGLFGLVIFLLLLIYLFYNFFKSKQYISVLIIIYIVLISAFSNFAPYYKLYLVIAIVFFIASGMDMRLISKKSLNVRDEKNSYF